ncbi:hypothetical protein T06_12839 [Trichinella sp. T6]|nr:hypothetical protein T06_12839 [Trichinella sp. T6]
MWGCACMRQIGLIIRVLQQIAGSVLKLCDRHIQRLLCLCHFWTAHQTSLGGIRRMVVLPLPPHLLLRRWLASGCFSGVRVFVPHISALPIDRELYINRLLISDSAQRTKC